MFQGLRDQIREGRIPDFRTWLREQVGRDESDLKSEVGYDILDLFVNGLLSAEPIPEEYRTLEPEMVYYQKTPVRVILELVDRAEFKSTDVFYDLGSGLGQVPLLVNLLTGIKAKGVEYEPVYCDYARRCAEDLNADRVSFVNADVRDTDLSDGTVFFLYTPFMGNMLKEVLQRLKNLENRKGIRIFTYGPCTAEIRQEEWLRWENPEPPDVGKLGLFTLL